MRKTILTCDKCEKEVNELFTPKVSVQKDTWYLFTRSSSMELCNNCITSLNLIIETAVKDSGMFPEDDDDPWSDEEDDFPIDFFNKRVSKLSEFD